jgi:hypothetical protein
MTEQPVRASEQLIADYMRSTMRVGLPATLAQDVMRAVATTPQARRTWFSPIAPFAPAIAAVAAIALVVVAGSLLFAPRTVGPPAGPTPSPTITPEDARILTTAGDVIRIPALDGDGQFGTITIRRGEDKAGYEGFVPVTFEDVFFVELYVTYEPTRSTSEQYGEWEYAFSQDLDENGFEGGDQLERGVGFLGMEGQPGFASAPQPLLQGKRFGNEVLEGWLVLEIPARAADTPLYLVYGHGEWTNGIDTMTPDASALLRSAGPPVGVTAFDPNYVPPGSPGPMPSLYALPTPVPSPAATFEPAANAEADALFKETQTCTNAELGVTVTFPASYYTNQSALEVFAPCALFAPEPITPDLLNRELRNSLLAIAKYDDWLGGIEEPQVERIPIAGRPAWRLSWTEDQLSSGTIYLVPLTDDPYGPFVVSGAATDSAAAILERILVRLQFSD